MTRSAIFAPAALFIVIATTGWYWVASRPRPRTSTPPARIESVAVLPFENLTGDSGQEYLADAVTEGVTTDLAQIDGLQVISRTSTRQYKGTTKRLSAIGADLGVDTIVEGSIARAGDRLRVSAQVIQAAADRHLWARTFEGDLRDVRRLQDDIGRAISAVVSPDSHPVLQIRVGRRAVNNEAYDAYLKGVANVGRGSQAAFRDAVVYFDEAIAKQPDFAMAYAAKAQAQLQPVYAGPFAPRDIVPHAEATVRRALELDDSVPLAHRVLGTILHNYYYRWEEGDRENQRVHQLRKNDEDAHRAAANAFVRKGRFEEAIAEAERARKLDPLSLAGALNIASILREAGQYVRALAEYRHALQINPDVARTHFQIGVTYTRMSQVADAIPELEEALRLTPDNTRFRAYLAWLYVKAARAGDARKILTDLQALAGRQYVSSFGIALIHDALNEPHETMAALERAYDEHAIELAQLKQYPPFESVRSNSQYEALIRRVARHE